MTNGLYGYYDTKNEYVVYIGRDADIGSDKRHKEHHAPSFYDNQVINRVVQSNPQRYTYFRFIEGEYDDETLNELEKEAIRLFKTYKYDYPERNVFNFQRGGKCGSARGQHSSNWRNEDYKVIKYGIRRGKQRYCILGRCNNKIKISIDKKKLEELAHKLNNKEITERQAKDFQIYNVRENMRKAIQSCIKYNMWNTSCCNYDKGVMFRNNSGDNPRKCFRYKYKCKNLPIGLFHDFVTCQIINSIVKEAVKNEK